MGGGGVARNTPFKKEFTHIHSYQYQSDYYRKRKERKRKIIHSKMSSSTVNRVRKLSNSISKLNGGDSKAASQLISEATKNGDLMMDIDAETLDKIMHGFYDSIPYILSYDVIIGWAMVLGTLKLERIEEVQLFAELGLELRPDNEIRCTSSELFYSLHLHVLEMNLNNDDDITKFNEHPVIQLFDKTIGGVCRWRKDMGDIAYLFTDPKTDPGTKDDEQCIVLLEKLRDLLDLWNEMYYVVMAKGGLVERATQIEKLLERSIEKKPPHIVIYDTDCYEEDGSRFYAPVGFPAKKPCPVKENASQYRFGNKRFCSFYDIFEKEDLKRGMVDTVGLIGQMGVDFMQKFCNYISEDWFLGLWDPPQINRIYLQGPGFNTLGTDNVIPRLMLVGDIVYHSNKKGAVHCDKETLKRIMKALGRYDPSIEKNTKIQIWNFFGNDDGKGYFPSMFTNFCFQKDGQTMLNVLEASMNGTVKKEGEDCNRGT